MAHITHKDIEDFAVDKVNLSSEKAQEYRDQVNGLRERLKGYFASNPDYGLVKSLHSGSVAKGTALKKINDMDLAIYLKKAVDTDETALLNWLLKRLEEANPNLKPEQFSCPSGSHCVTISYKGTGLDVDVVPVLQDENENDDYGYLLAKDTGDKVLTNISFHLEFIRERKKAYPKDYAQLVRLIKWWVRRQKNSNQNFRFKSLMVELLIAFLAKNGMDLTDYPSAIRKFFAYIVKSELKERVSFDDYYDADQLPDEREDSVEIYDPVNPANNVCFGYTDSDRDIIVNAANDAYDAISYAESANTKEIAVECWQKVFGPSFNP